jgi:carboxyl-terminal processing protease
MMRKTSIILLSAATGAALTLFVTQPRAVFMGTSARAATSDTYRQLNLFGDVFERVRSDYVEKPDDSKLVESAISGMLTGLDPHSSYMDAKSFRDMQVQTRGEFGGLGIEVTMEDGLIKVVSPIDDTPASKAGIMANDIITSLDEEAVQGLTLNQAVEKMRGPVNTKIKLKIIRKGQDNPLDVTLVRDNIRVRSVRARVESDDIAYIRITTFNEQTTEGLKREIAVRPRRSVRTRSRATSSTSATIRAVCSKKPSPFPTRSSSVARSSRPAVVTLRKPSAARRMLAI